MSKKRKCIECAQNMNWALPERVTSENVDYAKHCISIAKHTRVCGHTMKTKTIEHEQYCNHFRPKSNVDIQMDEWFKEDIERLEKMIQEFESKENIL